MRQRRTSQCLLPVLFAMLVFAGPGRTQSVVTTVAGTDYVFTGDGKSASQAQLGRVVNVAVDSTGNVYTGDTQNHLVYRIAPNGLLTVVAGNGVPGFSGDGGSARNASFVEPILIAIGPKDDLYIADTNTNIVRRVDSSGTVTTIAGGGPQGSNGVSGDGGPPLSATFFSMTGIAVGPDESVYIVDLTEIRRISNGTISHFAGGTSGPAGTALGTPIAAGARVAVDSAGNIYYADSGFIREITSDGTVTTIAGGGTSTREGAPALQTSFRSATGLAVDSAGNIYIAESGGGDIREITTDHTVHTVAGTHVPGFTGDGGPAISAQIGATQGVSVNNAGVLYIADADNLRVRSVDSLGVIRTIAGIGQSRFSGDGIAAVNATFGTIGSTALDSAGNLFVSDSTNHRVRKVGTNGVIGTIVGTGVAGDTGDEGPGTSATLFKPDGLALAPTGDLFIADRGTGSRRIRRLGTDGIIHAAAGKPGAGDPAGFSLPIDPRAVQIGDPAAITTDSAGNLFYLDPAYNTFMFEVAAKDNSLTLFKCVTGVACPDVPSLNTQVTGSYSQAVNTEFAFNSAGLAHFAVPTQGVYRLDSNYTFNLIAGSGKFVPPYDAPDGITFDPGGNVVFTNAFYIYEIGPSGINQIAGVSPFSGTGTGDGGAATLAPMFPVSPHYDSQGNLYFADLASQRVRVILAKAPSVSVAVPGGSLSLTQASGGKPVMASVNVSASIGQGSALAVPGMAYTASVTTGGAWLSVSPQSGSTPGLITATADPLNLAPGSYNGTIAIGVPLGNPATQTVSVTFTVTAPVPSTLSLDQSHMSFTYATTSAARSQTLIVSNTGGGALDFATFIVLNSGVSANWLDVTPKVGTATPGNPVSLAVTADPSKLGPGTYTASLTVIGKPAQSITIPITMTITTNPLVMLLSQAGLTFTTIQNGGAVPPQTFGVLNLGSGTLNWTVQTSTLTGGNWLSATPPAGQSSSASAQAAPLVSVQVNQTGLAPDVYYGLVKVISPAANTPQEVVVVLQVLQAGSDLPPIVQPSSLIFNTNPGISPSSQNVLVYDPTGTGKSFRSAAVAAGGTLATLPSDAVISPAAPTEVVVQPFVSSTASGTYNGMVSLQFSDGRVSSVGTTVVVASGSVSGAEKPRAISHANGSCTPTILIPVLTTLGSGFTVPAGYPEGLTVQVSDDCGNPLTQGQVSVEFSTGQGLKYMQSLNNGRWDITWNTGAPSTSVTLTVHAVHPTLPIRGDTQITGELGAIQAPPQVHDGGVVSAASFTATPVAPGGFISIFGSLLSDATSSAPVLPLPTSLNNTTVKLGDRLLPLFYTNNGAQSQLNALVPYGTPENTNLQLLVQRDSTYATPVYVDVAAAQPGVLQYGTMQAVAVDLKGNLIGPSNPAHAGDLLTMYCLGLGAVSPAVGDGAAAPSNPPAATTNTVTVTVGSQTASVYFAGLTPTLAGLYQINFYVPQNSGTGNEVPVQISTAGQTSIAVNLSVQ